MSGRIQGRGDVRGQSDRTHQRLPQAGRGRFGGVRGYVTPYNVGAAPPPASRTPSGYGPYCSNVPVFSSADSLAADVEMKLNLASTSAVESDFHQSQTLQQPSPAAVTLATTRLPDRPGFGRAGKKILIRTNHFPVQSTGCDVFHYDVSISPEVTMKKVCREIMNSLIDSYMDSFLGNRLPAYDGRKSIYTLGSFPFVSRDFNVKLFKNDGNTRKEHQFIVAIKFAAKIDMHQLQAFLHKKQGNLPHETLQALEIVLRSTPSVMYTAVKRSFFSPKLGAKGKMDGGLEYWQGFYQSLRPTQMGLSLNIDISAKPFFDPILVTEFIQQYLHIGDLSRPLSNKDCENIIKVLKGVNVQMTHLKKTMRKKIVRLSQQPIGELMFTCDDGVQQKSVVQYYLERYHITIRYPSLPAMQSGSDSKPIYLPLELCKIVEGQRYTKKLNERQVTTLLMATCQRPTHREQNIRQMVRQNDYNNDKFVNEFGLHIHPEPTVVEARLLPPPLLKYAGSQEAPYVGQWNMLNKRMFDGAKIDFWTCVNFSKLNQKQVGQFCWDLVQMCINKGLIFNKQPLIPIHSANSNHIGKALTSIHSQCNEQLTKMKANGRHLQLLLVILPEISGSYGMIKKICETELGIVSQCFQPKQVLKRTLPYLENVTLKINVKAGGRNTVLASAFARTLDFVCDKPTIIFGADVTHPAPGEDSSCSIAAVVASMDWPEVTTYKGLVSAQKHREEIISDLYKEVDDPKRGKVKSGMIRELLISFNQSTGRKPDRIIFYRDGVSDGQFSHVLLYEIDAIRKACSSLEENYLPRITFVVVQKRHHTRLFPMIHGDRHSTDRSGNILPGTVVDTKICHVREFDFYLCSHSGIQGTSRPTHYHVLFDENDFSADALQGLTNNLCYTYARCTRSVSIVPPVYYAHLAASRARYYMEGYVEGDGVDAESTSVRMNTREGDAVVRPLPNVMDNVKKYMFYC
ncbi:protein argonaute MEL1-like [Impatiens glandulifera]|uniref:protein argonaute MEL1-like n=1 Tax=Impatiens glandulifera TaxID=253017 RepID=UPI001FB16F91|nr:protein argonaute MEL1-like [Impatiens glandulifera]